MNSAESFTVVRKVQYIFALVLLMGISACKPAEPESYTVGITGYNFTAEGVQDFYVDDQWGSNIPPYGGGGKTSCCVVLPKIWRPGLVVKIDWKMGDWTVPWSKLEPLTIEERSACCWVTRTLSKIVPVEPYGPDGGRFQVFFLPNDEVKVWVSTYDLGHENHPSGMKYPHDPDSKE